MLTGHSFFSLNLRAIEFMQKRWPVGVGLSSNMCPRCPPQFLQLTSVLCIPKRLSEFSVTLSSETVCQKLGQPVPESNFVSELNSSFPQAMHRYIPVFLFFRNFPVNAGSVPFSLSTWYSSGERVFFHSSSVLVTFDFMPFQLPWSFRILKTEVLPWWIGYKYYIHRYLNIIVLLSCDWFEQI